MPATKPDLSLKVYKQERKRLYSCIFLNQDNNKLPFFLHDLMSAPAYYYRSAGAAQLKQEDQCVSRTKFVKRDTRLQRLSGYKGIGLQPEALADRLLKNIDILGIHMVNGA
eukprot:1161237-Pelagomonas_calceolata.AAC.1